jgi:tRNA dimethylallyltransferase
LAPPLIAIVGPTASGKSALGLLLARETGGEIVSCDSLQVYRGFDVGSAKPTAAERQQVPHHMIDVVEPEEGFSAADYAGRAREAIAAIKGRGRLPIVVGGTGLYLRALLQGLFAGPGRDEPLRKRLEGIAERGGPERLHRLLARADPETASRLHPQDVLRVVRALEVFGKTRRTLSSQHREGGSEPLAGFEVCVIGISTGRDALRKRVCERTAAMLARGLLDEAARLLARPQGRGLKPLQAIGYRQAVSVLCGERKLPDAERDIVTETMRYAKRQMTWFRHQPPPVSWSEGPDEAARAARRFLEGAH